MAMTPPLPLLPQSFRGAGQPSAVTAPIKAKRPLILSSQYGDLDQLPGGGVVIWDFSAVQSARERTETRKQVAAALKLAQAKSTEVLVRLDAGQADAFYEDVVLLAKSGASGIVLRTENNDASGQLSGILSHIGGKNPLSLWLELATMRAVLNAGVIAASLPRESYLILDIPALATDMAVACQLHQPLLRHAILSGLLAARAYGHYVVSSGVIAPFADELAVLGFSGMILDNHQMAEKVATAFA